MALSLVPAARLITGIFQVLLLLRYGSSKDVGLVTYDALL